MVEGLADDDEATGRSSRGPWRLSIRHRRVRWPVATEHGRALRSTTEQMVAGVADVDAAQAPRLRGLQQLHLRGRRSRRLHGIVECRALQSPLEHLEPDRRHDLATKWGECNARYIFILQEC